MSLETASVVFGWHPWWLELSQLTGGEALATVCGSLYNSTQLDYYGAASRHVRAAIADHSARGIDRFVLTGHSMGAALALLVGSSRTPPLAAVGWAPGAWRSARLRSAARTPDLRWATSIVDASDPVPYASAFEGELLGTLCRFSAPTAEPSCTRCNAPALTSTHACSTCQEAKHNVSSYFRLVAKGGQDCGGGDRRG